MLPLSQRLAFGLFTLLTLALGARGFYRLYLRVNRGCADTDLRKNKPGQRAWYALKTTLGQGRVFRKRPVLSVFHAFIFYAFVLYLLVNLLDAIEGFVPLRTFAPPLLSSAYGALADAFSVLAIVGVLAFVLRRFVLKSRRDFFFNERTLLHPSVRGGYIQRDSIIVSAFILFHVGSRVVGNAARLALTGREGAQPFSSLLAHAFAGQHAMAWRIFGYWGALGSVLLFLVYFPYSKHVHLLMTPLKYFFKRDAPSGELPFAKIDLEAPEPQIGAGQLAELAWPRLLDAYACIQCNRCQDVCPASQTGKALSPAALEINKRMVLNRIAGEVSAVSFSGGTAFERGQSQGPELLQAVISPESVWACTTCGACMEVCPTENEQMLDIVDLRRNMVMLQGEFPAQLGTAFRGMERASNPWGIARDKRMAWAEGLHVPTIEESPNPDVLYWVGCAAAYDPGAQKTARAVTGLLTEAKVNFAVLGKRESCTGDSARRAGNELLYQELAAGAIKTLNEAKPKLVIASCPHCVNTISAEYPQLGGDFKVMHHTEYLASLLDAGKLTPAAGEAAVTFHDPCYLGRHRGTYEQPRSLLKVLTNDYVELDRTGRNSFCCGAGGAQFWKEEEAGNERVSENRFKEAQSTLAAGAGAKEKVLAVGCPFCKSMLQSTPSAGEDASIVIKDVAELLWEGVQRAKGSAMASRSETVVVAAPSVTASPEPAVEAEEVQPAGDGAKVQKVTAPADFATHPISAESQSEHIGQQTHENAPAVPKTPERKKWAPKATAARPVEAAAEPQRAEEEPAKPTEPGFVEAAEGAEQAPAPARKKWQPGPKR